MAKGKSTMARMLKYMMVCAGLGFPVLASAQQSDAAYCSTLAQTYERYVGSNAASRRGLQRDATVDAAISQCATKSASAIPVLEQGLRNARIDLPPHN